METRASPGRNWVRFAAAAVIAAVVAIGIFRLILPAATLEVQLEDRIRIAFSDPASGQDARISLVTIDEATMATLPYRSPVDRGLLADVVTILDAAGARAIGLDILLDQPTEPEKDARLAEALQSFAGDAVLAWADARAGMTEAQSEWLGGFLNAAGATAGFVNLRHDADGVVRRQIAALAGSDLLSFSEALAGGDSRLDPVGRIDWQLPQSNGAPVFQETPAHVLPLMAANPQILRTWFEDRIVLVGASLPQQDRHPTPVSTILGTMQTTGLHIHAHVIAQLLDQRRLPELAAWQRFGYIFAMSAIASALASLPLALAMRVFLLSSVVALHLGCIYHVFDTTGLMLPIATALTAILLSVAGSLGVDAVLAHKGRRYVRQAFGHYLAPELVDHLVRNPGDLRLGGERRRMTFLFTDLAGFTSMSERMEAEKIAELLNSYLDGVSEIIMRHNGVIDKFIGDAVVALFGVPQDDPAHAARALACAAEIDEFAERFRLEHARGTLGVTRIGVHTGEAVVGNFGGSARFDYTAIGDAMNTAARLEGANKAFGTRVCFSSDCLDAAEEHLTHPLQTHPVGGVILKGKSEPIMVFALRREKDVQWHRMWCSAFDALHRNHPDAPRMLDALADDPLCQLHLDRLSRGESGTIFGLSEK